MHQVAGTANDRVKAARATFAQARDFRRAAVSILTEGLILPAVSAGGHSHAHGTNRTGPT